MRVTSIWVCFCILPVVFSHRNCDIKLSLEAKSALDDFIDVFEEHDMEISIQCPFHPKNNMFSPVEKNYRFKRNRWKCKTCNTNSRSEIDVYDHILSAHPEILEDHGGNVCLADYCDILGCESTIGSFNAERRSSMCSDSLMQKMRFECFGYFQSCFPHPRSPRDQEISDILQDMYCNRFYCYHENEIEMQWQDPSDRKNEILWWWLKLSVFLIVASGICVFYFGLWLWKLDSTPKDDLQSLRKRTWFNKAKSKAQ